MADATNTEGIADATVIAILPRAKVALNTTTTDTGYENEIKGLIKAGYYDLEVSAGINMEDLYVSEVFDELLLSAILTYVCYRFAVNRGWEPSKYKQAYDDQKTMLQNSSKYNMRMEEDDDE